MLRLELVQDITESFSEVITELEGLRIAINDKNFIPDKPYNFGGTKSGVEFRFSVFPDSVSFKLINDSFVYIIYLYYDYITENTIVYTDDLNIQIECGRRTSSSVISLVGSAGAEKYDHQMDYPIQEEQYFQYLSVLDLAPETFYDKVMNYYSTDYLTGIHLNSAKESECEEPIQNLISDPKLVKSITDGMKLVIGTFRSLKKL